MILLVILDQHASCKLFNRSNLLIDLVQVALCFIGQSRWSKNLPKRFHWWVRQLLVNFIFCRCTGGNWWDWVRRSDRWAKSRRNNYLGKYKEYWQENLSFWCSNYAEWWNLEIIWCLEGQIQAIQSILLIGWREVWAIGSDCRLQIVNSSPIFWRYRVIYLRFYDLQVQ